MACLLENVQIKEDMIVRIKNASQDDDGEMPRLEGVWSFLRNFLFIHNEFAKKNLIE